MAWMPRALRPHAVPRAVPPAHPALFLRAVGFALLAMALGAVLLWSAPARAQTNNPATGSPSISGVLEEDEVLTADTVSIADADDLGAFSYQWLAGGTAISGATSSTYTLTATEVGDAISLTVTFTDGAGNSESLTSAATQATSSLPAPPASCSGWER